MNINALIDLYRHMEWADAAVWTSVLASEGGRTDAKLRAYLYHPHVVQRAFLRAWRGEPRDWPCLHLAVSTPNCSLARF